LPITTTTSPAGATPGDKVSTRLGEPGGSVTVVPGVPGVVGVQPGLVGVCRAEEAEAAAVEAEAAVHPDKR
jgi:hypothetical protein